MDIYEKSAEYYDLIYQSKFNYEKECDLLENVFSEFSQTKVKRILDIGCGTGSHSLILSRCGYAVTGIDISKVMIDNAKKKAEKDGLQAEFFVQDMRRMQLDKKFDCTICMNGTFCYIQTYEELVDFLSATRRHLNEKGLFVFEYWSIGGLRPYLPYKSWEIVQNDKLTLYRLSESSFDHQTNSLTWVVKHILTKNDNFETFDETHNLRCYTLSEIRQYLSLNGFKLLSVYNWQPMQRTELKKLGKDVFRILAVSKTD